MSCPCAIWLHDYGPGGGGGWATPPTPLTAHWGRSAWEEQRSEQTRQGLQSQWAQALMARLAKRWRLRELVMQIREWRHNAMSEGVALRSVPWGECMREAWHKHLAPQPCSLEGSLRKLWGSGLFPSLPCGLQASFGHSPPRASSGTAGSLSHACQGSLSHACQGSLSHACQGSLSYACQGGVGDAAPRAHQGRGATAIRCEHGAQGSGLLGRHSCASAWGVPSVCARCGDRVRSFRIQLAGTVSHSPLAHQATLELEDRNHAVATLIRQVCLHHPQVLLEWCSLSDSARCVLCVTSVRPLQSWLVQSTSLV